MGVHDIRSRLRRRLKTAHYRYSLFTNRFNSIIRAGSDCLGLLAFIASVLCLICLVVIAGYDHQPQELEILRRLLQACRITFITKVMYDLVLRFRSTSRNTHAIKWIVDAAVIVSLTTLIYPQPIHPWIPALADLLYSRAMLYAILTSYSVVEISYAVMRLTARRTNPSLLLSGSFLLFILAGSLVLMLPKCTTTPISYIDSLFVATSAVCITGLTPIDIASALTPTGLAVLAVLVQIGGIGVLTFTCFFALFFSGAQSVYSQLLIRDMVYSKTMNALIPTLLYIIGFTLTVEAIGAAAIYLTIPDGLLDTEAEKITFAAFHSLSSFCNAGFSCLPGGMANPGLMTPGQSLYNVTSVMILAGALGFPILVNFKDIITGRINALWRAFARRKRRDIPLHMWDLNTKLVLVTTLSILAGGSAAFFVLEYDNTLAGMTLWQKMSQSVFNSLIPRSAGFASVNPADFLPLTLLLVIVQMWIGGASQSLAGGIKVNTVATVLLNVRSVLSGGTRPWAFGRRLSVNSVRRANSVIVLAIVSFIVILAILMYFEPHMSIKAMVFEVSSALFTVGSSLGVTAALSAPSKIALCVAMFIGRVGIVSILSGFFPHRRDIASHLPEDNRIIN